jgi:Tol biopolymer transport system component
VPTSTRLRTGLMVGSALVAAATATVFFAQQPRPLSLVLVDRDGRKTPIGFLPAHTFAPRISPDGKRVAYDAEDGGVWIAELSRDGANLSSPRRIGRVSGDHYPMWSAAGDQIVITSDEANQQALYIERADGTGTAERLATGRAPESWSAPNQMLSFITLSNYYSIWTYSLRDKKAVALIDTPGVTQHSSRFSPDGKWIAYTSVETGRFEVFVQPIPRTGAKFQITKQGGGHALWSPDGKELFFDNNQQLFAVSVQTNGTFSSGTPVALPIRGFIQGDARRQYDIMPDGKQFLMMFP